MRLFLFSGLIFAALPGGLLAQAATAPAAGDAGRVLQLEPFKVTGAGVTTSESVGVEPTDLYDASDIEDSGVFDIGEFFDRLPTSPAGTEQLVLIDGKPTYMDVSKLPPEMIASIEVSNYGALPQYGAYAEGRVINIRLKTNYRSENLSFVTRGAFEGGGLQTGVTLSGGVTRDKLRLVYGVSYRRQESLLAGDRDFSRQQDHTGRGGTDLRLLWGDASVVQAVEGNLSGVRDANGQPTAVALTPENQNGLNLTPGSFLAPQIFPPANAATAAGQRRFNTADYITLIAPSEEKSMTFNATRTVWGDIEATLSGSVTVRDATRGLAPPVTGVSDQTLVPAVYNPFGQDVEIGMVHTGFGPVRQSDASNASQLGLNLEGKVADTWRWGVSLGGRWNRTTQEVIDLDRTKFAAALMAADPAQRFNPFGEDPRNALLYPQLAVDRSSEAHANDVRLETDARGDVIALPGGPMRAVVRGHYVQQIRDKSYDNSADLAVTSTHRRDNNQGATGTLIMPWFSQSNARTGLQRLETTVASGYSTRSSSPGGSFNERLALLWSPHRMLSFNGSFAYVLRAPSRFVADLQPLVGETFVDPRRFPSTATDVELVARDFDGTTRSRRRQVLLGTTFEPPVLTGLQVSATYDRQQQDDLTSAAFKPQDLIYNELTFPGRVVREAPTEDDLLLGQPGRIVRIDTTPVDNGIQESSGLSFSVRYRRTSKELGQFNVMAAVRHPLTRHYEVIPGVPFVFESDNQLNPPDWSLHSQFSWNRRGWNASMNYRFVDEVVSGGLIQPATSLLNLQFGYRFTKPFIGKWGRGCQVAVGLGDIIQGRPPFADTINGFRSGSPLGRTYSLTLKIPLNVRGEREKRDRGGMDEG